MRYFTLLLLITTLFSCSNQKELPVLKTSSKTVSIQDGNKLHNEVWTIDSKVELDEFVTRKFTGEKEISFFSEIDTLTFNVSPNNTYDFIIQYKSEKAFTRINTDTLKEVSMPFLEYFYDNKTRVALTDTIPFVIGNDHRIYLKGKINKSDTLNFLFDTGANGIVIVSKLIGDKVNLEFDGEIENKGGGGRQIIQTSSSNKLEIGNLNWDKIELLSINYKESNFDCIIGWVAFENKIVEIDYDKNKLIIHKSIKTIPKGFSKVETKMVDGSIFINGTITIGDKTSSSVFLYDSGANGSIRMSQKYASDNNLNEMMAKVGTATSLGSTGNKWKSNKYILPKLQVGEFKLSNVPLLIQERDPKGIEPKEVFGNNLLKRFNTIIDLQNFEIYLKPNSLLDLEY